MAMIDRCPLCDSKRIKCNRPYRFLGFLCFLFLILPWVFWMLLSPKVYRCKDCRAKWKA